MSAFRLVPSVGHLPTYLAPSGVVRRVRRYRFLVAFIVSSWEAGRGDREVGRAPRAVCSTNIRGYPCIASDGVAGREVPLRNSDSVFSATLARKCDECVRRIDTGGTVV